MAKQTIAWTALPAGLVTTGGATYAKISVFVSPRLLPEDNGKLEAFDFLNWANLIKNGSVEFRVSFGNTNLDATILNTVKPELWTALFDSETPVHPHTFDTTSKVVNTYPAARLHDLLRTTYQRAAAEPPGPDLVRRVLTETFRDARSLMVTPGFPSLARGGDASPTGRRAQADLAFAQSSTAAMRAHLDLLVDLAMQASTTEDDDPTGVVEIISDDGGVKTAVQQFITFHLNPRGTAEPAESFAVDAAGAELDFHRRLTMLSEYPELLRALGVVVDLRIKPDDIPAATLNNPGYVRVVPNIMSAAHPGLQRQPDVTPSTAYIFVPGRAFAVCPRQSDGADTVSGLLNLHHEGRYTVQQVDIDSAGLKLADLLRKVMSPNNDAGEIRTLPALRSTGVTIARRGQAIALGTAMASSRQVMSAADVNTTLYESDLIRGYRVDVGDPASGNWYSLHHRSATHVFTRGNWTFTTSDEGWAQETVVQAVPQTAPALVPTALDPAAPNSISEFLFNWQGWSLSAPRPGAPMPEPTGLPTEEDTQQIGMTVALTAAKGSLPRLRYGRSYRLRLRTVDLAGNGLTLQEADTVTSALGASAPVLPSPTSHEEFRFQRFEPVPPPTLVPRVALIPASNDIRVAGADRIVIRSDFDRTPAQLAAQNPDFALDAERHVVPSATFQQLAEMHGMFDASIGTQVNHAATHMVACREERAVPKVYAGTNLPVDWLPDPLAAGAAFWGLPGFPTGKVGRLVNGSIQLSDLPVSADLLGGEQSVLLIDFGTGWPNLSSFRLKLAEGKAIPAWNPADRVLTVFLEKGETRHIRVSSYLRDDAALDLLGVWEWARQWLKGQVANGDLTESESSTREAHLEQLAKLGLSLQTPVREITLVHAVARPAGPPPSLTFTPTRVGGSTSAYTRGKLQVHPASSATVELIASWTELIDAWTDQDGAAAPQDRPGSPTPVSAKASVFASPFPLGDTIGSTPTSVPAHSFDASTGTVSYSGPPVESLFASIDACLAKLREACGTLTTAAGPTESHVEMWVTSAMSKLRRLGQAPQGPDSWTAISVAAGDLRKSAQDMLDSIPGSGEGFPGEFPGEIDPSAPYHLTDGLFEIVSAAGNLQTRADRAVAEARRFHGRHEFGDTKHRRVTYHAVVTSRFEGDFPKPPAAGDADFSRLSNMVEVDIPSSVCPEPPAVRGIIPAFAWTRSDDGVTRSAKRRGALRVYLERPWFTSGDEEKLGVLVLANPSSFPPHSNPFTQGITVFGRDPLWKSPHSPVVSGPANFPNADTNIYLGRYPNDGFARAVLGFDVDFDSSGRCFCDIEVVTPSYYPFIRLTLVRYQPHAVPGAVFSPEVAANFAQVAPERSVSAVRGAAKLSVSVSGTSHTTTDSFGRTGNRIKLTVQGRIPGTTDEAGWQIAPNSAFVIAADPSPVAPLLWKGTVTLPAAPVTGEHRLLIEELEPFTTVDGGVAQPTERVVFLETIPL